MWPIDGQPLCLQAPEDHSDPALVIEGAREPKLTDLHHAILSGPVGILTLVASDDGLVAVLWEDERPGRVPLPPSVEAPDHPILTAAATQLDAYFAGRRRAFELPLEPVGTPFQRAVWSALTAIPFGETRSYAAIARAIGRPAATRAVGAANGRNPLSIVVPCHRVIGSAGALTGFAGGLTAKRWLLAHESGQASLLPATDCIAPCHASG